MSKVVDWQKRAERLNALAARLSVCDRDREERLAIIALTERDEPDAAPVPAFEAGQWVRHNHSGHPYQVRACSGGSVWFRGYEHRFHCGAFSRITENEAVRAELASIRARLDEIAAKVGA